MILFILILKVITRFGFGFYFCFCISSLALAISIQSDQESILGPNDPTQREAWRNELTSWRNEERRRLGYNDYEYRRPELMWTQSSFVQPQTMVEDRFLYDPISRRYTVDKFLLDLNQRYGGIDSVLLWPVYPNLGIDNRNQHDMLRAMPGGLDGLKQLVQEFHNRGVRVLFPAMPWDIGTRQENMSLSQRIASDMAYIGADGINGDTFFGIPREYRFDSDNTGHAIALQPENYFSAPEMLIWNTLSWGYWQYQSIPVVSRNKWMEPRHMVNVCERWARDRSNGLQSAFFNGVGYESWESIWGIWNGFTARDSHALKQIATIERAMADLLVSPDWQPHIATEQNNVFGSLFQREQRRLWFLVNRGNADSSGLQLTVPFESGVRFYDLWHGIELQPSFGAGQARLYFEIEGRGYGAILAVDDVHRPANLYTLLNKTRELAQTRLGSLSAEWKAIPQQIVEIAPTQVVNNNPEGMIFIPGSSYRFQVAGVEIEGGNEPGVDVQYPWESLPVRNHDFQITVPSYYIDRTPVTNAQFARFLQATHYWPDDSYNFLKDWQNGAPPRGWENKPVTWVSLEDARAYAKWAGKRLPHEWEWQYAAQGRDGRTYPWGNNADTWRTPALDTGRNMRGPDDVTAHPDGASPFGVLDMVGNIWQWTEEFQDTHTRSAIVRGGSYYSPQGSGWYFPQNRALNQHGKLLLMSPGKDRAGTLGFRCVVDAQNTSINPNSNFQIQVQNSKKCLAFDWPNNGTAAIQKTCNKNISLQNWKLVSLGAGVFQIVNSSSGKCLDVGGFRTDNGAPILEWDCVGGPNQKWTYEPEQGAFMIRSVWSNLCLDMGGYRTDESAPFIQWSCLKGQNQLFLLQPGMSSNIKKRTRIVGNQWLSSVENGIKFKK